MARGCLSIINPSYPIFLSARTPPSSNDQTLAIARTAAWAISNLARGHDTPAKPFLPIVGMAVTALRGEMPVAPLDADLRVEAAWIVAFLLAKDDESVWVLVRAGTVPPLVQALADSGGEVILL